MKVILFLVLVLLGSFFGWQYIGEDWVILRFTFFCLMCISLIIAIFWSLFSFLDSEWWMNSNSDSALWMHYIDAGAKFGDAVSYLYVGECVGFDSILENYERLEQEYANRGYRTIPLKDFIAYGGYGKSLPFELVKREASEEVVLYGKLYREKVLGKNVVTINFNEDGSFGGTYELPDF